MEPRRQVSQGVQVHLGVGSERTPELPLGARFCLLLAPIIKFQLLIASSGSTDM